MINMGDGITVEQGYGRWYAVDHVLEEAYAFDTEEEAVQRAKDMLLAIRIMDDD